MGGCKGVLAVDTTLGDDAKIVIRPSMEKFKCNDRKLELFSKPRTSVILFCTQQFLLSLMVMIVVSIIVNIIMIVIIIIILIYSLYFSALLVKAGRR